MTSTTSCTATTTLYLFSLCLLFLALPASASPQDCDAKWMEAAQYFGATIETFSRGFALGFGIRMMKFTWVDGKDVDFKERMHISCESGLAVACMVHGAAILLPHKFRQYWLESDSYY